ncbi:PAB-dependent poly(A)-specific ribonuclease subunit 3 [Glutinoglossum americanum]|uniref:PAN2-PAN3 deadenylation complex subunit PAN3 n=1 Tax=Glutinoglossum americanum TaxID=1670608 RepID=A0A9P8IDS5_9PEZI|nr:PAB-dependent poly(A)-specific ribonuclease subunit 3 [Glutinoglossum americanum]
MWGPYASAPRGMAAFNNFSRNENNPVWMLTWTQGDANNVATSPNPYDPFTPTSLAAAVASNHQNQLNPYVQDATAMAGMGSYYQGQGNFTQPLQYHLYAPLGPHRENLLAYQRTAHDFFFSDALREELQRKSEASLQVLPNSSLPAHIDHFHSLVPLDTTNQKNATIFGYPSWVYKAVSSKDGHIYALRRLEGYRLTNEKAIRSVQSWKRVSNSSVVTIHDAFTTRAFGDSSLVFVMDYHPLSKTLADNHFGTAGRFQGRPSGPHVPEPVLWSYIVQISSALKTIHSSGLSARLIEPTKVLLTNKNRIRLNSCAIFDVVQHDSPLSMVELQQDDLVQFGRLILSIATNNPAAIHNIPKAIEHVGRLYTTELKDCILWLLSPSNPQSAKGIDQFLGGIAGHLAANFDYTLHYDDQLHTELNRELENSRILRLMTKLNFINERPEFAQNEQWSETGERYFLKLFRDYVFHQVDAQGNPVIDLAHVLTCLAKLDAGVDEKISLVSRDEQNCLVVSYKELKRGVDAAFQDLLKASRRT